MLGRVEPAQLLEVGRGRQHHRAERRERRAGRTRAAGDPVEQRRVGGRQSVPVLLDLLDRGSAHPGQRHARHAGREADAHVAGGELEEGQPLGGVEPVERARDHRRQRRLAGAAQQLHRLGEAERLRVRVGPDQRDGLGQVAHEIIAEIEQHRVHALGHQPAQQARGDGAELQLAGQRRQRIAAVGVGRLLEIMAQDGQLGVSGRREGQPLEQPGEPPHSASSS